MISGQAFERQHKATAAGGLAGSGGGVVAALFEAGSRRCGAVRTRWRSGSWRARLRRVALVTAQVRVALFCSPPLPPSPVCLTDT